MKHLTVICRPFFVSPYSLFTLIVFFFQIADEVDPDHQSDEGIDHIQGKYPQNTALLHH